MNTNSGAGGAVPVVNMLDYLQPEINRPDLYYQKAYPVQSIGSGSTRSIINASGQGSTQSIMKAGGEDTIQDVEVYQPDQKRSLQRHNSQGKERTHLMTLYYTIGLIVLSAAIFLSLAAWSNVLLSWYDSIYVSPAVATITQARLYFAITLTVISLVVIIILLFLWYYFTIHRKL